MSRLAGVEPGPGAAGLFAADDEVGRDLEAVDWAATPLGAPASWPQSLQTAVDILLSSRFAMWMAWGPQLTPSDRGDFAMRHGGRAGAGQAGACQAGACQAQAAWLAGLVPA